MLAGEELPAVELWRRARDQIDLTLRADPALTKAALAFLVAQCVQGFHRAAGSVLPGAEHADLIALDVIDALEFFAHADRPGERHRRHAQMLFDFVEQFERLAHFAVELVDEGDDRRLAAAADFEQLQRLRFDTVGAVDHHHGGIDRGQHTVGIFGEVLVARRVEQVDHGVAVLELHDRTGHRNAPLLFDLHPVRGRVAIALAALHGTGDLNRAREQQQLFSQRGLARVRVGNDRERAAAFEFGD